MSEPSTAVRRRRRAEDASANDRAQQHDVANVSDTAEEIRGSKKTSLMAYIYWLFGGIFGWHQFYLERDTPAFMYATSGGYFFIGWIRDLFTIPKYVREVNQTEYAKKEHNLKLEFKQKPGFFSALCIAQVLFAGYFRAIATLAIPQYPGEELPHNNLIIGVVGGLTTAATFYFLGNVGLRTCSGKLIVVAALIGELLAYAQYEKTLEEGETTDTSSGAAPGIICSLIAYLYSRSFVPWGTRKRKSGCCGRFLRIGLLVSIFWLVLMTGVYQNVSFKDTESGESVRVKDSIQDFFNSDAMQRLRQAIDQINTYCSANGWGYCFNQLVEYLQNEGLLSPNRRSLYEIMELEEGATDQEIKAAHKKLALRYHPDKCNLGESVCAQKFSEMQQAYEKLKKPRRRH